MRIRFSYWFFAVLGIGLSVFSPILLFYLKGINVSTIIGGLILMTIFLLSFSLAIIPVFKILFKRYNIQNIFPGKTLELLIDNNTLNYRYNRSNMFDIANVVVSTNTSDIWFHLVLEIHSEVIPHCSVAYKKLYNKIKKNTDDNKKIVNARSQQNLIDILKRHTDRY
jgi:hypothetical protein